ncbi:hypothetical protein I0C86_40525 [Plantactinospora sp. S1510]|uniref:Uncharacterized protein n=1 Tax=Plantactinospora alkalitolerans TaxID=2789879 RepID=A0ABS0H9K4_9ACTN|nr:hypothetical protein [Plantactinospora alkalitolerans]MBF9135167.1 hypothetical protein [Plantactinospora alkalitolerans]
MSQSSPDSQPKPPESFYEETARHLARLVDAEESGAPMTPEEFEEAVRDALDEPAFKELVDFVYARGAADAGRSGPVSVVQEATTVTGVMVGYRA